jgi:hypothetical protein
LGGIRESFVCEGGCVLEGREGKANAFRQGEGTRRGGHWPMGQHWPPAAEGICGTVAKGGPAAGPWPLDSLNRVVWRVGDSSNGIGKGVAVPELFFRKSIIITVGGYFASESFVAT